MRNQSQALNGQTCQAKTHERKHVRHVQASNGSQMHVAMSTLQVLHVLCKPNGISNKQSEKGDADCNYMKSDHLLRQTANNNIKWKANIAKFIFPITKHAIAKGPAAVKTRCKDHRPIT